MVNKISKRQIVQTEKEIKESKWERLLKEAVPYKSIIIDQNDYTYKYLGSMGRYILLHDKKRGSTFSYSKDNIGMIDLAEWRLNKED